MPYRSSIKEEAFYLGHGLGVQPTTVEKAWLQKQEAAGHIASAVRKQRGTALSLSSLSAFPLVSHA